MLVRKGVKFEEKSDFIRILISTLSTFHPLDFNRFGKVTAVFTTCSYRRSLVLTSDCVRPILVLTN